MLYEISLHKDVDGFHPLNIGKLAMKGRDPLFVPCTPKGCIELLSRYGVEIEGKRAVVLGRSNIVGVPVSMLLLERNATLTVCHSRTKDLPSIIREVRASRAPRGGDRHLQAPVTGPPPPRAGRHFDRRHRQALVRGSGLGQAGCRRH